MDLTQSISQVNRSGFPFQLAIANLINETSPNHGWKVASSEHPWHNGTVSGFIDLVLEHRSLATARLVVECKRVKADDQRQLRWIFLLPVNNAIPTSVASSLELEGRGERVQSGSYQWQDVRFWDDVKVTPESFESGFCVLSADDPNRQSLLERMAQELLHSTESLVDEEVNVRKSQKGDSLRLFAFPAVVTNARLFTCTFDPAHVNLENGTLKEDEMVLNQVPFIRFRKSLATAFPTGEFTGLAKASRARERTLFVVNAESLPHFLQDWDIKPFDDVYAIQRVKLA